MIDLFAPPSKQEIKVRKENRQKNCTHEWVVEKACCINDMPMMRCVDCKVLSPITDEVFKRYLNGAVDEYYFGPDEND